MERIEEMADVIMITALAIIVFFIVRSQLRKLRKGQCGAGCAGCCGSCCNSCEMPVETQKAKAEN